MRWFDLFIQIISDMIFFYGVLIRGEPMLKKADSRYRLFKSR